MGFAMDRSFLTGIFLAGTMMVLTFSASDAEDQRVRIDEDYYQNDIDSAVREAERNRRSNQFDYSNRYWYNRTTAESFELPQLGADDLEQTNLEGAINPSAAGEANIAQPDLPEKDQATLVQEKMDVAEQEDKLNKTSQLNEPIQAPELPGPVIIVDQIEHRFPRGDTVNVQGLYSTGTLTSTPRE